MSSAPGPWARKYDEDPTTEKLLKRGVVIPNHQGLHEAADAFLYPPFKAALGKANTELLGMHHYTVHIKIGIAKEYLDELQQTLSSQKFDLATAAAFEFNKILTGFFTSLFAAFDNVAQELSLVYDLRLQETDGIWKIFEGVANSEKRRRKGRTTPTDARIDRQFKVFSPPENRTRVSDIGKYRNYLTHRKIPTSMTAQVARVSIAPQPTNFFAKVSSGGTHFDVPSGSLLRQGSPTPTASTPSVGPPKAKLILPRLDKLDALPSETQSSDLDSREIVDICEEYYTWTVNFLGSIFGVMAQDFRNMTT
jgi:hypothetical protein